MAFSFLDPEGALGTIDGSIHYLQVPLKARLEARRERQVHHPALNRGWPRSEPARGQGRYHLVERFSVALTDDWFGGQHAFNLSLLLAGGVDVGLGRNPEFLFGIDVIRDSHLLSEWNSGAWGNLSYKVSGLVHLVATSRYSSTSEVELSRHPSTGGNLGVVAQALP